MLSRQGKALFYATFSGLMYVNGRIYRWLRAPSEGCIRVHLGPGQKNYLPGWINADANMFSAKCDVWIDLRHKLPFRNDSVDAFYSHHVVEHLPDLTSHFADVYRCLKPGGTYRVGGPNGDSAIRKFVEGDKGWFFDFPDNRRSIGGRFENFVFCRQEHLTILTRSYLEELLTAAGFHEIRPCRPIVETTDPELFQECLAKEFESDMEVPHTLLLEVRKPGGPAIDKEVEDRSIPNARAVFTLDRSNSMR